MNHVRTIGAASGAPYGMSRYLDLFLRMALPVEASEIAAARHIAVATLTLFIATVAAARPWRAAIRIRSAEATICASRAGETHAVGASGIAAITSSVAVILRGRTLAHKLFG
jgi:hypothetical protein